MITSRLLEELGAVGLALVPSERYPHEWYTGRMINGKPRIEIGPYPTPDEALVAAVCWLFALYDDAAVRADVAETEAEHLAHLLADYKLLPEDQDEPPEPFRKLLG